jgi:hypothetical protein
MSTPADDYPSAGDTVDDSTYRQVTAIAAVISAAGVIVIPIFTALLAAGTALLATRWEARRAEQRASDERQRQQTLSDITQTQESLIDMVLANANDLMPPGVQGQMKPAGALLSSELIDDVGVLRDAIALAYAFNSRPRHSGLTPADLLDLSRVEGQVRDAARRQRERVLRGEAPIRLTPEQRTEALPDELRRPVA